jgi:hypothetical protein
MNSEGISADHEHLAGEEIPSEVETSLIIEN